jgi:WS/DGAT/MGAT family acyltransferase
MSAADKKEPKDEPSHIRRLSGQDSVFIYAETPSMGMHVMGTLVIDPSDVPEGEFDFDHIVRTMACRLHMMPPYRQRLLEVPLGLGHPVLVDDSDFRVENHVHRVAAPAPGTLRELAEIVGDIASRPLLRSQPLWEMTVVEGLAEGRIALVTKMHHCMIDGASGSSQMSQLLDLSPDASPPPPPEKAWNPPPLPGALELGWKSAGSLIPNPLSLASLAWDGVRAYRSRKRAVEAVTPEGDEPPGFFDLGPKTRINQALSHRRAVAYGSAPLDEIKRIKNAYGVTVNDAVLAACTLALRHYLEEQDDLPDEPLVSFVPISTKTEAEKADFSNKVSTLSVRLPTHLSDPDEIVAWIREATASAKQVFAAVETDVMPQVLELLPPAIANVAQLYSGLNLADGIESPIANVVVSNMIGPPIPLYFGGARVEAVYPMGPVAEGMGLNITLLSNMGRVDVGVLACPDVVPDVWNITEGFARAVEELGIAAEKHAAEG